MKIETVDSLDALNLERCADFNALVEENKRKYPLFHISVKAHRAAVADDVASFDFNWGMPLAGYLPPGHDVVDPSDKDIDTAARRLRQAAIAMDPDAMVVLGEWCTQRTTVADFRTSVWDIARSFLVQAANAYKKSPLTAAHAREILARLYEDGHYYTPDNEAFAQKLRSSAATIREAFRRSQRQLINKTK